MGMYDEVLAELPKSKGMYDDVLSELDTPKEKGFVGKLIDRVQEETKTNFGGGTLKEKGLLKPQQRTSPRKEKTGFADEKINADAGMPEITKESLKKSNQLDYAGELLPKPKRTLGDQVGDTANAAFKIAPTAAKGLVDVANYLTQDSVDIGASETLGQGLQEFDKLFGSDALNYENEEFNKIANSENQGIGDQAKYLLENPTQLLDKSVTTLGSAFIPAGVAGAASKVAAKVLGNRLTPQLAAKITNGSVAGTVALQNAADTFNDPDIAKLTMAERNEAAAITLVGTLFGNKLFGGGLEKAIADKFNKTGIAQGFALAGKEAGQEISESLSQSVAKEVVAPDSINFNQAAGNAVTSGLLGGVVGGGFAATQSKGQRIIEELKRRQSETTAQDAPINTAQSEAIDASTLLDDELLNEVNQYTKDENVSTADTDATVVAGSAIESSDNTSGSDTDSLQINGSGQSEPSIYASAFEPESSDGSDLAVGTANEPSAEKLTANIDVSANEAATSDLNDTPQPTQAQKEAGNYKVGRVKVAGLDISIENPDQSLRSGVDKDGKEWTNKQNGHYGYAKGVVARAPDKEHVDVNIKTGTAEDYSGDVFVVNQNEPTTGKFDEPKVYLGYSSQAEAEAAYRSNYDKNWEGLGSIAQVPMAKFKEMLNDKKAFLKPVVQPKLANLANLQSQPIISTVNKPKKPHKKTNTLHRQVMINGGISRGDAIEIYGLNLPVGTNPSAAKAALFRKNGKDIISQVSDGMYDDFLPPDMRHESFTFDSIKSEAFIKDLLAQRTTVLPYNAQQELSGNKLYERYDGNAERDIETIAEIYTDDEINEMLREAGYDEREATTDAQEFKDDKNDQSESQQRSTQSGDQTTVNEPNARNQDSRFAGSQRAQSGITSASGNKQQPAPIQQAQNHPAKDLVTSLVKRRSAAQQIGKEKQFDAYLALAKDLMNGKQVKSTNFKMAAAAFKDDAVLSKAFTQLSELSKSPSNAKSVVADYQSAIANAKTIDELQAIAGQIQRDKTLTDAQAVTLDDAAFDAQDALENTGQTLSQPKTEQSPEAAPAKAELKSVETVLQGVEADGWTRLAADDANNYVNSEGNKFRTYKKDGVRIALRPNHSLKTEKNAAILYSDPDSGNVIIEAILVDDNVRKQGKATATIKLLNELADKTKSTLYIEPVPLLDKAMSKEALTKFYAQMGFAAETEAVKVMVRKPNQKISDLLGDNTAAKQAIADAERAKDAKRNIGEDSASDFKLSGSSSETDKAVSRGAQTLFSRSPSTPRILFAPQGNENYIAQLNKTVELFNSGDRRKIQEAGNTPIAISRTPVVLRQVLDNDGTKPFKRAEFVVGQGSTLYLKANNAHGSSLHSGRISKKVLDNLPQLIADPIAVFKSSLASEDSKSFKVLLDATDENGSPVIVAIKPNVPMQQLNNAFVNFQATIFPTDWNKVNEWNEGGLLRYYNEKSPRISVVSNNPREAASKEDTQEGFDATIGVSASKVKVVSRGEIQVLPQAAFSRNNSPVFYSALTRAIENIQVKKAAPAMWKGMIRNLTQKGVKPDEVEWTGINEWLDLQTGVVTKEQVQDYFNGSGLRVEETELNGSANSAYDFRLAKDEDSFDIYKDGKVIENVFDANKALSRIEELRKAPSKYSQYTVPGGENYKELLLTLPTNDAKLLEERANLAAIDRDRPLTATEQKRYDELRALTEKGKSAAYKSSHFDQLNILAHVRFDERADADGSRVLFINEIQSDWAQQGKKEGFKTIDLDRDAASRIFAKLLREQNNFGFISTREAIETIKGTPDFQTVINKKLSDIQITIIENWLESESEVSKVPTAPFVQKTDAWVSLALKRMLRYAADNGFDKVAIINGQQAADLYDLSKQVDSIAAIKNEDGTFAVFAYQGNRTVFDEDRVAEARLPEIIGKELAEKVAAQKGTKSVSYSGVDLKIGGEGMLYFYDTLVPKVAKDVLKKLGGSVEVVDIPNGENELNARSKAILQLPNGREKLLAADHIFAQTGFTITPAMREQIMGGLPLFSKNTGTSNLLVDDVKEAIKNDIYGHDFDVYQSVSDTPGYIQRQIYKDGATGVEGFFDTSTNRVALIVDNLSDAKRAVEVARHELIGHYGIENMLNDVDKTLLPRLLNRVLFAEKNGNKVIVDLGKDVDRLQPNLNDNRRAKEIIAIMAERNIQNSITKRVIDAIRTFLKKIGFVKGDITDAEVAKLLRDAQRYLKNKSKLNSLQGQVGNVAVSFSANIESVSFKRVPFKNTSTGNRGAVEAYKDGKLIGDISLYQDGDKYEIGTVNVSKKLRRQGIATGLLKEAQNYVGGDKLFTKMLTSEGRKFFGSFGAKRGDVPDIRGNTPQTDTPAFKKWFGDSKVVDENGEPLVVYHGTTSSFTEFDLNKKGINTGWNNTIHGFFFLAEKKLAEAFAKDKNQGGEVRVVDAYLSIKNPMDIRKESVFNDGKTAKDIVEFITGGAEVLSKSEALNWLDEEIGLGEYAELYEELHTQNFNNFLKDKGYDGLISNFDDGVAEYIAFEPTQIKSATGNNGDFDGNNDNILFSRSQLPLNKDFEIPETSKLDSVLRTFQDKNIDLKRVTANIKKAIGDISDNINAYLQEELYHGRSAKRTQDFLNNELNPLIAAMQTRNVTMADFEEYLQARHAEERNIQIAKVNPDMPDGGSGMTTKEANDYLGGLTDGKKRNFEALAKRVDAITKGTRQVLVDYNLESAGTVLAMEGAYKHYVPLMREDMDMGFGQGTGQGFSVKGNSTKRATGSNRAVVDILANIAQQRERSIIRGEKNRVSTALFGLAKLNPNDEFWDVDTPPKITAISKATGLVEEYTDPNYKNRDNVVVARIKDKNGNIQERAVIFNERNERAVKMAAGIKNLDQDQMGEFFSNAAVFTRYFASINTQYNPMFGVVNIMRDVQGALLNLSSTALKGKQADVLKETFKIIAPLYKEIRTLQKKGASTNSDVARLYEDFAQQGGKTGYQDMFRNAAERGKAIEKTLDKTWWQQTKLGKVVTANGVLATPEQWLTDKAVKPLFKWLSDYNEALENTVRLATYKVGLENGLSKQQAASTAKNISVNFNRKGNASGQIGALYAFFNASVQGTARIGETLLVNNDGKISLSKTGGKIVAGGMLLGAMQALAFAMAGFDDEEPPEFIRDRNIVIPTSSGKYLAIPMPLGFNAIPATGRIITEWALSGGEDTGKRVVHLMDVLLNVTNPIGNAGLSVKTVAPTLLDPLAALSENKDFSGRPIAKEDFSSKNPTPGYTRARDNASSIGTGIAYFINSASGGNQYRQGAISPTPDQIDYLFGQATGGVGREGLKIGAAIESVATGEDIPNYKKPLIGKFYGDAKNKDAERNAYFKNIVELNKLEGELKGRRENKDDVEQFKEDNPLHKLIYRANETEKSLARLKKQRNRLEQIGAPKSRLDLNAELVAKKMKMLNDAAREIEAVQ